VFTRSGTTWTQEGQPPIAVGDNGDGSFGPSSIALSANGETAAITANVGDDFGLEAASVFSRTGSTWAQQGAMLTARNKTADGIQNIRVALSADGKTAIIAGTIGNTDNKSPGAAWVFTRSSAARRRP
jgi:hypothetical protein